jgi:hypothetical protein
MTTQKDNTNIMDDYGFIITRHVNSEETNKYWNRCVKLIKKFYPYKKIVIIDDNSNKNFVKADFDYKNILIVPSKYHKRGELLPYIYYSENKWFEKAVIIHDSVFFHSKILFENIKSPVVSLWHFPSDNFKTHYENNIRVASVLNHKNAIINILSQKNIIGCFGVQSFIKHSFLCEIMKKYNIPNLIKTVRCREDRCSLERIFAVIFYLELGNSSQKSVLGNIFNYNFGFTFKEYQYNIQKKEKIKKVVKVFTGR